MWRDLFGWRKKDADIEDEIESHLQLAIHDRIERGESPSEAQRAALLELGNRRLVQEATRAVWVWPWCEGVCQDVTLALRSMRRQPGFTAVAIVTLMIGIGANTAIFSVVNAVLLKPLAYPDPDRLVVFLTTSPNGSSPGASPAKFNLWRQQSGQFQDVAGYRFKDVNFTGNDPEQIGAGQVSANFFRLFGAQILVGRTFNADEDRPSGGHVVVLTEHFWKDHLGGDPTITGRTVALEGDAYTVLGVVSDLDPDYWPTGGPPLNLPDIWLPLQLDPQSTVQVHYFIGAGRLKPGVTLKTANAQLQLTANEFRRAFPSVAPAVISAQGSFVAQPLQELIVGNMRSSLWMLVGAVSFVLLIACANVANLLLVRATAQTRELAVRAAIGAGRGRIIRQVLTESVVLATMGGVLGLALGMVGIRALLAVNPGNIPHIGPGGSGVNLDGRVVAFTVCVSLTTALVFGVFPALRISRADLNHILKRVGRRPGTAFRQHQPGALLVASQIAFALVLLVGAALFVRTFVALRTVNPGFDTHNVVTMRMSLTGARFERTSNVAEVIRNGVERLRGLAVVDVAAAACCVPLQGLLGLPFTIEGRPLSGPFHGAGGFTPISPTYFGAFRIPVVRGRVFTDRDDAGAPNVMVINETMARRYWPKGDPLTDSISIGKGLGRSFADPPRQVVGVVGDVRGQALSLDPQPMMYVPWAQLTDGQNANLLQGNSLKWIIRARGQPTALSSAIQRELGQASGGVAVARLQSMDDILVQSTARSDFNMLLLTVFAGSALLLAAIGIYGLMAYSVQQRTQEIGIRLALGADARQVRNLIIRQGMSVAIVGITVGVASALGLTRLIAGLLFGVTARDPMAFAVVSLLVSGVALVGVWLPASGAAHIDPAVALRAD